MAHGGAWRGKEKKLEQQKARREADRAAKQAAKQAKKQAAAPDESISDAFWSAFPGGPLKAAGKRPFAGEASPAPGFRCDGLSPLTMNGRQATLALRAEQEKREAAEAAAAATAAELEQMRALLAEAQADAKKSKRAPPPFGRGAGMPCANENCGCGGNVTAHATNAFMVDGRSEDAAARKARRVGEKLESALKTCDDAEQAGAALQQAIAKRAPLREAAAAVGIRTAAQLARCEEMLHNARAAVESFKLKKP